MLINEEVKEYYALYASLSRWFGVFGETAVLDSRWCIVANEDELALVL
jgi:hypothetical protein